MYCIQIPDDWTAQNKLIGNPFGVIIKLNPSRPMSSNIMKSTIHSTVLYVIIHFCSPS